MAALLEVNDLKTYIFTRWGVVRALDGVSLSVNDGETLGLVGESGCGKSTLCHSLIRLLPKAARIISGEILLDGEDLTAKSEREMAKIRGADISMILQDPMTSLDPVFTVGSQLAETIALEPGQKGRRVWDRATELLRMVWTPAPETRLGSYPHQFSGGMRQRVVGAIAIARSPRVLIADEPTSALDVITQANYLSLLKELRGRGNLALLFVTHDFGVVARICDRVGVMYAGKLVEIGPVKEILERSLHPYTRALLRSVPMADRRIDRLDSIAGEPPVLYDLPPGCAFAPRCNQRSDNCRAQYPPPVEADGGHRVNCWLYC